MECPAVSVKDFVPKGKTRKFSLRGRLEGAYHALKLGCAGRGWTQAPRQVSLGASLLEESIREGQRRVFPTPERRLGCLLCRGKRVFVGSHPHCTGQVSRAPGTESPIGEERGWRGAGGGGGWSPPSDPIVGKRISRQRRRGDQSERQSEGVRREDWQGARRCWCPQGKVGYDWRAVLQASQWPREAPQHPRCLGVAAAAPVAGGGRRKQCRGRARAGVRGGWARAQSCGLRVNGTELGVSIPPAEGCGFAVSFRFLSTCPFQSFLISKKVKSE